MTFLTARASAFRTLAFAVICAASTSHADQPISSSDVNLIIDPAFSCSCTGNCNDGGLAGGRRSTWRVAVDSVVMRRDQMDAVPLVVDSGTGNTLLAANDLDLGYRAGLRLSVARQISRHNDIEFEFFSIEQLGASATVAAPGAQLLMYGATFGSAPLGLEYDTDLRNFEVNWCHYWGSGRIKTLIGFRGMELGEHLTVNDLVSPPGLFLGDVNNQLIGGQIGIEGALWQSRRCEIEGGLKCGVYRNSAEFDAAFPQAGPGAAFQAAEDHTAFSGELWLGVNYDLTDWLALRLGYQAMWVEGVAILPEQLDDLAVPILGDPDVSGSPFYHGATFGLQVAW